MATGKACWEKVPFVGVPIGFFEGGSGDWSNMWLDVEPTPESPSLNIFWLPEFAALPHFAARHAKKKNTPPKENNMKRPRSIRPFRWSGKSDGDPLDQAHSGHDRVGRGAPGSNAPGPPPGLRDGDGDGRRVGRGQT